MNDNWRVIYMGSGEIGLPALRALLEDARCTVVGVVTQPDRAAGRGMELRTSPIKAAAREAGVAVLQPERLRRPESVAALAALEPELIVVMAYGQILPKAVLDLPRLACLNLHASLLPRHRGAAPIQAAILAGDAETGITVMYMDEGMDTGDILLARSLPIRRRETGGSLQERLALLAPLALRDALDAIQTPNPPRIRQDPSRATCAPKLSRDDGRIDWTLPARSVERRIRAMNPWPAAFADIPFAGRGILRVKVFSAIVTARALGEPGEVLRADARGILVAAGGGGVLLREVQLQGRRRMPAGDLVRGHPPAIGESCIGAAERPLPERDG